MEPEFVQAQPVAEQELAVGPGPELGKNWKEQMATVRVAIVARAAGFVVGRPRKVKGLGGVPERMVGARH